MNDLVSLPLLDLLSNGPDKKILCGAYLNRIKEFNPKIDSFLSVNDKVEGIPVGFKDVFSVKGLGSTAASKILKGYISPYEATVVKRLRENGVGVIGKTNLDEFACGSSGENSAFYVTKNPWDTTRVSGGSSSGSAAAVAADFCVFAMGTDTGGSIRQPASLCGVVGLKPSYGRVSRYGVISMASSLDCPGPITKTVKDARKILEWISGPDGYDSNIVEEFKVQSSKFKDDLRGLRVGVPREYFGEGLDPKVKEVIKKAIKKMEELGAEITEVELPYTKYAIAAYYIIMSSELSANLARFDGLRFGDSREEFGDEVKRRIMLGTFALLTGYYDDYFVKAAKVRALIKQDFEEVFRNVDVVVGPVSPTTAWKIGEKVEDPLTMYLSDVYTIPASLAGVPALSVPCGFTDGLPVGLQIIGKYMDEDTILNVGEVYENATDWRKEKPKL